MEQLLYVRHFPLDALPHLVSTAMPWGRDMHSDFAEPETKDESDNWPKVTDLAQGQQLSTRSAVKEIYVLE